MNESVHALFKLALVVLGLGIIIFSRYMPYKQPNPSLYVVTDKESFMKYTRKMFFTIGVSYIILGILYLIGFYNLLTRTISLFIPVVIVYIFRCRLKKYYKKIES